MTVRFTNLTLHYQPQVSSDGQKIVAVEALVRVLHPTADMNGPADVLATFTDPAAAEALDWWIVERALVDAARWPSLTVSINLSADRFRDAKVPDRLAAMAVAAGIPPRRIELEIVESAYIGDFETASSIITRLRDIGFGIAIDDFGTGYSSLSYLLQLPIDKLKIDKSFVDGVTVMRSAAIVQGIVAISRALGIRVTAEGVETPEQWRILRAAGCHYLQGWLFSKAVDADTIDRLLAGTESFVPATRAS